MRTMLERIADAERQADRILEEANQRAKEQIAAARDEAGIAVERASEAEREKTARALAAAEAEGNALKETILASVRTEIETVREHAETRLFDAVAYLTERIEATL